MNERLKSLYKEVIVQHNKSPYHFEKKEKSDIHIEANNPLCGDRFELYIQLKEERIEEIHFYGFGCAISKASTSILVQKLEGLTLELARERCQDFLLFIEGKKREAVTDEAIEAFTAVDEFPARKECAVLVWSALNDYLSKR